MKARKWTILLFGAYLPLVAVSVLTFGMSFRDKSVDHRPGVPAGSQPNSVLPKQFTMALFAPAAVGGQLLRAGEYKVDWWQDGESATVSFTQADTVQAVAHGKVETKAQPAAYSIVITRPTAGGVNVITEMQFQGKVAALVLSPVASMDATGITPQQVRSNVARLPLTQPDPGRNAQIAPVCV